MLSAFTEDRFVVLGSPAGAIAGIVIADAWMWSPFVMLLVLAGLVSVPKYLYEAAEIDRASSLRRFWTITFPYIKSLLLLAVLFRTIETFKLFDIVYIITEGGPGSSTETIAVYLYRTGIPIFQDKPVICSCVYRSIYRCCYDKSLSLCCKSARRGGWLMTKRYREIGKAGWSYTLITSLVGLIYFSPVLWIILTSFKTRTDALAVPPKLFFTPTLDNFASVFYRSSITTGTSQATDMALYFFNSIFIAGTSVGLALIVGTLAAYAFSRYPLRG